MSFAVSWRGRHGPWRQRDSSTGASFDASFADSALVLLCLARWSDGFDVTWAVVGGAAEEEPRGMFAWAAWWRGIEFVDDLGTGYAMRGASSHGAAPRRMGDFRAGPAIPDHTTVLTMQLHDADDHVVTRVDIELDAP